MQALASHLLRVTALLSLAEFHVDHISDMPRTLAFASIQCFANRVHTLVFVFQCHQLSAPLDIEITNLLFTPTPFHAKSPTQITEHERRLICTSEISEVPVDQLAAHLGFRNVNQILDNVS